MTLSPTAGNAQPVAPVQAPVTQTWLSLDARELCRHWITITPATTSASVSSADLATAILSEHVSVSADTATASTMLQTAHCTTKWHSDAAGGLISDDPAWVATPSGAWPANTPADGPRRLKYGTTITATRTLSAKIIVNVRPAYTPPPVYSAPVSAPSSVPVAGHTAYAMSDFAGDPWSQYFGYCTWWAWYRHQDEPLLRLGNAMDWAWNAPKFGLRTGTVPAVGATVVFQPGVEGAGSGGHVGHVEQVLSNGQFVISEMNFYANGGGWGRVDWRVVSMAPGVTFVY